MAISEDAGCALPEPLDVTIVGPLDLMVTAGDSDNSDGFLHIYHRDSDSSVYSLKKTLQGKQGRNLVEGPNYIGMLELVELEHNVEVLPSLWKEITDNGAFTYISRSMDTFGYVHVSNPGLAIKHRLRIAKTGDERGFGVQYVGDEIIPANIELMVYAAHKRGWTVRGGKSVSRITA
eukprot:COSAG01_NODE_16168_length_1263_cov_1.473368_1_plen_177_part_00